MVKHLWDQNFQGNRYVILNEENDQAPNEILKTSVDYSQSNKEDDKFKITFNDWRKLYDIVYPR